MPRTVKRCPCGSTAWKARVGGIVAGAPPEDRYYCEECKSTFSELEEGPAEHSGETRTGLAGKLADPDFNPEIGGGSA
jgi:transposase-like protein